MLLSGFSSLTQNFTDILSLVDTSSYSLVSQRQWVTQLKKKILWTHTIESSTFVYQMKKNTYTGTLRSIYIFDMDLVWYISGLFFGFSFLEDFIKEVSVLLYGSYGDSLLNLHLQHLFFMSSFNPDMAHFEIWNVLYQGLHTNRLEFRNSATCQTSSFKVQSNIFAKFVQ